MALIGLPALQRVTDLVSDPMNKARMAPDPGSDPVAIVEIYLEPFGIWQAGQGRAHFVPPILKGSIGD